MLVSALIGWFLGEALWPFLLIAFICWVIYEVIFNFWATLDTVISIFAVVLGFLWDMASSLFMSVWDITLIGPILAIGGTLFLLRYLFAPALTVLFWICAIPIFLIINMFKNLPKAGMPNDKANNPENTPVTTNTPNEVTVENTNTNN